MQHVAVLLSPPAVCDPRWQCSLTGFALGTKRHPTATSQAKKCLTKVPGHVHTMTLRNQQPLSQQPLSQQHTHKHTHP